MRCLPAAVAGCLLLVVLSAGCHTPSAYEPSGMRFSPEFGGVYHTVRKGQTLWRISRAYGVDLETVQWVNDIDDVTRIRVGRKLFIPGVTEVLHVEPYRPEAEALPPVPRISLKWPLEARVSSRFGPRGSGKHHGIDLPAPVGTPVAAAAEGKVVYSGQGMRGYGKVVVIKHDGDFSTVYAHNSVNLVRMGNIISEGQTIARVGATGRATGPHLHFEVRRRGIPEDPMGFLPER